MVQDDPGPFSPLLIKHIHRENHSMPMSRDGKKKKNTGTICLSRTTTDIMSQRGARPYTVCLQHSGSGFSVSMSLFFDFWKEMQTTEDDEADHITIHSLFWDTLCTVIHSSGLNWLIISVSVCDWQPNEYCVELCDISPYRLEMTSQQKG